MDHLIRADRTQMQNLLALARWAHAQFRAGTPLSNYPPWDAVRVLHDIRKGDTGRFFCSVFARSRAKPAKSRISVRSVEMVNSTFDSGHITTEVWVPTLRQWVLLDETLWGEYYTGLSHRPLSALELHEYAVGTRRGAIWCVPSGARLSSRILALYYHFETICAITSCPFPLLPARGYPSGSSLDFRTLQPSLG